MPRIRSIKPGFFRSEDVSSLPMRARLTWIGLWTQCDDHGRTKDSVRLIKGDIWPLDEVSLNDIEEDLSALARHGRIVRYTVDGKQYLAVVNWHVHQAINRPGKPACPAPPAATGPTDPEARGYCSECSASTHAQLTIDSLSPHETLTPGRGRGKEGEREGERATRLSESPAVDPGPGPEPPRKCPKHTQTHSPGPCGACADARREHDSWVRAQRPKPAPQPGTLRCPLHPLHPTGSKACPECAAEQAPAPNLRELRRATKPEAS